MDGPVQTLNGLAGMRNSNDDRPLTPSKLVWLGTTNVVLRTYARGARRIVRGGGEDSAARSAAANEPPNCLSTSNVEGDSGRSAGEMTSGSGSRSVSPQTVRTAACVYAPGAKPLSSNQAS